MRASVGTHSRRACDAIGYQATLITGTTSAAGRFRTGNVSYNHSSFDPVARNPVQAFKPWMLRARRNPCALTACAHMPYANVLNAARAV